MADQKLGRKVEHLQLALTNLQFELGSARIRAQRAQIEALLCFPFLSFAVSSRLVLLSRLQFCYLGHLEEVCCSEHAHRQLRLDSAELVMDAN